MGRSQETFSKKEREKKKQKKRKDKEHKKEERKANAQKSSGLDDMIAYVDENGRITSTPPDPKNKQTIRAEDIQISIPKHEATELNETSRTGKVTFFNESKGYGFIKDTETQQSVFVHINSLQEPIAENDKVTFEVEMTPKGQSALNVRKSS